MSQGQDDILKVISAVIYGNSVEESQKAYDAWSSTYDEHLDNLGCHITQRSVELYMKHVKDLKVNFILDVGAGTGTGGKMLRDLANYQGVIDIMDANMEMLYLASKKNLGFRNVIRHLISEAGVLPVRDESYDVMFCVGSFIPNHIPATSIRGMLKAVRKGGLLIFTTRAESTESYKVEFDSNLAMLEQDGELERLDCQQFVHFANAKNKINSSFYVYRRL